MLLQEVIARFNTTPFLFVGSGITRRYYGLPDWDGLLQSFATRINPDRFSYQSYKTQASARQGENGLMPMTATLIQRDFDKAWFSNEGMRMLDEHYLQMVEKGVSPFKVEIASLIAGKSKHLPEYSDEIKKLKAISKKNIAGIITTNYDLFFETLFEDYKSYVGQDELVFSAIQGVAEIYKIHGSVSRPDSIVINAQDYQHFNEKSKYLAAKLMTIFMEYPIIFLGYSISDPNIKNILQDIVACLPNSKFERMQERFVFVEYKKDTQGAIVSPHSIDLDGRILNMTKVTLGSFGVLYDALAAKRATISVKTLRRFKEDIYTYVLSNEPGPMLQVAALEDEKVDDDKLCMSIGLTSTTGDYGLKSIIDVDVWYKDIVTNELDCLNYSYEKRLDMIFESTFKGQGGCYPVHKYLAHVDGDYPRVSEHAAKSFEELISNTNRKNRKNIDIYPSVSDLWEKEKADYKKATRLLGYFPEEKLDAEQLHMILSEIFEHDENVLKTTGELKTNMRRLIRIYDYLRWGKNEKKTPIISA